MKLKNMFKLTVWIVVFTFCFAGVSPAFSGSRIKPAGTVKVTDGKKIVQVLKQEGPLPEDALLTTEGECSVRLENLYFLAEDGSVFAVQDSSNRIDLRLDKGLIYFAINQDTGKMAFMTPVGVISTSEVRLNAASDGGVLKGYIEAKGSEVKFGVLEGGTMLLSTKDGMKKVTSGKQIVLAIADPIKDKKADEPAKQKEAVSAEEDDDDGVPIPAAFFIGGGSIVSGAGLIYGNSTNKKDRPSPASPVVP